MSVDIFYFAKMFREIHCYSHYCLCANFTTMREWFRVHFNVAFIHAEMPNLFHCTDTRTMTLLLTWWNAPLPCQPEEQDILTNQSPFKIVFTVHSSCGRCMRTWKKVLARSRSVLLTLLRGVC